MREFLENTGIADVLGYLSPVFAIHLFGVEISSLELTIILAIL